MQGLLGLLPTCYENLPYEAEAGTPASCYEEQLKHGMVAEALKIWAEAEAEAAAPQVTHSCCYLLKSTTLGGGKRLLLL